jgi:hypothetical protein
MELVLCFKHGGVELQGYNAFLSQSQTRQASRFHIGTLKCFSAILARYVQKVP